MAAARRVGGAVHAAPRCGVAVRDPRASPARGPARQRGHESVLLDAAFPDLQRVHSCLLDRLVPLAALASANRDVARRRRGRASTRCRQSSLRRICPHGRRRGPVPGDRRGEVVQGDPPVGGVLHAAGGLDAFVTARTGPFYSEEIARFRQFVWLADAAFRGIGPFGRAVSDNLSTYVTMLVAVLVAPVLMLGVTVAAARIAGDRSRPTDREGRRPVPSLSTCWSTCCFLPSWVSIGPAWRGRSCRRCS
jgi:hypothetical protein